ncbi:SCP2 sterol-binding domain-containing protein [Myxococcota bacterium]|nr:SCP2 sterol-binding domain-containing protein [Myxococcota bacterium]MBU1431013.1 SCP2 sterol-binding domain-containing protein [Myxococcota bacterium]
MTPREIFEVQLPHRLADPLAGPPLRSLSALYQFHITGEGGGDWIVDLDRGEIIEGAAEAPDCVITLSDTRLLDLFAGRVDRHRLFVRSELEVLGDMRFAIELDRVLGL